jgi:hypothetical protein
MNHLIKKYIRLVCERYKHTIEYIGNDFLIKSDLNTFHLSFSSKNTFIIKYNITENNFEEINIEIEDIYDVLIELMCRSILYSLERRTGKLLDINEWISCEGVKILKKLKSLKVHLEKEELDFLDIGGNRIEGIYFKGLIILVDDLGWCKSNVLEFDLIF